MEPIFANCTRCEALASTLAPQSMSSENPLVVGISGASGARSTPLIRPTMEIKNSIIQCVTFTHQDITGKIRENLSKDLELKKAQRKSEKQN